MVSSTQASNNQNNIWYRPNCSNQSSSLRANVDSPLIIPNITTYNEETADTVDFHLFSCNHGINITNTEACNFRGHDGIVNGKNVECQYITVNNKKIVFLFRINIENHVLKL